MALKIRLRKQGRTNRPFYRLVVAESQCPRDGKYLEAIGWYNPFEKDQNKNLQLDVERAVHWLDLGAQATEKAYALLKKMNPQLLQQQVEKRMKAKLEKRAKLKKQKASA